jgi:membrane protease YdiL (CAAX protease family)
MPDSFPSTTRRDLAAVLFALVYPTILTVVYFILLAKQPQWLQQGAYGVGKAIQFLFPLLWVIGMQRTWPHWQRPRGKDLVAGTCVGLALLIPALLMYFQWLKPSGLFDGPAVEIRQKMTGLGVTSPPVFVALAAFYCVAHSMFEEYYWRWFEFGQLRRLTTFPVATIISALGFMSHHVFILAVYFGWTSPLTYLFSLAVAIGGVIWAWMYERTGTLYGTWISHALVDAAIFVIGYDLL